MDGSANILNWFEISVEDIARAKKFYESAFGIQMHQTEAMGMQMAFFPFDMSSGKLSGALVQGPMHKPSTEGAVIYLNGNPDLSEPLQKIVDAGGQVVMPKTLIDEQTGYMAFFIDTEGNKIGLHSSK